MTISPARIVSRPGEAIVLRCQPSGTGPFNIEWTRLNGQMNPQARERDGVLEIRQATRADAGRYRCRATNDAGSSEGFADVMIIGDWNLTQHLFVDLLWTVNYLLSASHAVLSTNSEGLIFFVLLSR